ncbi:MAG: Mu transposase C-terminal domain-containing protein [Pseudonocardiaceae bacterium]
MIDHVQYFCDALKPWIARRERLGRLVLRRDPRDISRIWALDPDGATYLEVPYRTLSRPPISVWEQQAAVARLREFGRAAAMCSSRGRRWSNGHSASASALLP